MIYWSTSGRSAEGNVSDLPIEKITKIDAAKRQLDFAIKAHFRREDPLPIVTLAHAAAEVLRDLGRMKGARSLIIDNELVRPEKRTQFRALVNAPANFLKHADRDPDRVLNLRPEMPFWVIFDAVLLYQQIAGSLWPAGTMFATWFFAKHPLMLLPGPLKDAFDLDDGLPDPEEYESWLDGIDALERRDDGLPA
jgi:hypothetical protein